VSVASDQIRTLEEWIMFLFARTASQDGSKQPEPNIIVTFETLTTVTLKRIGT
jgi:hypothetical protein